MKTKKSASKAKKRINKTNTDVSASNETQTKDGITSDADKASLIANSNPDQQESTVLAKEETSDTSSEEKKGGNFRWAVPLQEHIDIHFAGNTTAFGRSLGWTQQQINRWLYEETYWILDEIYLRVTRREPPSWKLTNPGEDFKSSQFRHLNPDFSFTRERRIAIPLAAYIKKAYDGKPYIFAEAYSHLNLKKQQVTRYMQYKCMWVYDSDGVTGELFRAITLEAPATKKLRILNNEKRAKAKDMEKNGNLRRDMSAEEIQGKRAELLKQLAEIDKQQEKDDSAEQAHINSQKVSQKDKSEKRTSK